MSSRRITPRELAYVRHAECLMQLELARIATRRARSLDNLTALHLAAHNLKTAECELADFWRTKRKPIVE